MEDYHKPHEFYTEESSIASLKRLNNTIFVSKIQILLTSISGSLPLSTWSAFSSSMHSSLDMIRPLIQVNKIHVSSGQKNLLSGMCFSILPFSVLWSKVIFYMVRLYPTLHSNYIRNKEDPILANLQWFLDNKQLFYCFTEIWGLFVMAA